MTRKRRNRRSPRIADRRLIGPHSCRVGGCDQDGTVGVDLPGETFGEPPDYVGSETWTRIYCCERHAWDLLEQTK